MASECPFLCAPMGCGDYVDFGHFQVFRGKKSDRSNTIISVGNNPVFVFVCVSLYLA
jgi:hypothetical protein